MMKITVSLALVLTSCISVSYGCTSMAWLLANTTLVPNENILIEDKFTEGLGDPVAKAQDVRPNSDGGSFAVPPEGEPKPNVVLNLGQEAVSINGFRVIGAGKVNLFYKGSVSETDWQAIGTNPYEATSDIDVEPTEAQAVKIELEEPAAQEAKTYNIRVDVRQCQPEGSTVSSAAMDNPAATTTGNNMQPPAYSTTERDPADSTTSELLSIGSDQDGPGSSDDNTDESSGSSPGSENNMTGLGNSSTPEEPQPAQAEDGATCLKPRCFLLVGFTLTIFFWFVI